MSTAGQRFDARIRKARGASLLLGVDEAGRGPLAGPVVVAAVLLGPELPRDLSAARDSKLLSAVERERLYEIIRGGALSVSVAWAHPREIERINILAATLQAMRRAVLRVPAAQALVVVDGNRPIPGLARPQLSVVDGDRRSLAVACASIVAKVVRDRWMARLDRMHPGYGLSRHKGYGTEAHMESLSRLGPSPIHRRTFAPVAALLIS